MVPYVYSIQFSSQCPLGTLRQCIFNICKICDRFSHLRYYLAA